MQLTVAIYKAVTDISYYSRSTIKAEAAERIAQAFGQSLESLGIVGIFREAGDVDFAERLTTHTTGVSVAVHVLAYKLQKALAPEFEWPACPYGGAGKSADWQTFTALDQIKQAIDYPNMYVREKRGPDKPAPKREGETGSWTILGSGEVLGYELIQFNPDEPNDRHAIQMFDSEDAAIETLVYLANEQPTIK